MPSMPRMEGEMDRRELDVSGIYSDDDESTPDPVITVEPRSPSPLLLPPPNIDEGPGSLSSPFGVSTCRNIGESPRYLSSDESSRYSSLWWLLPPRNIGEGPTANDLTLGYQPGLSSHRYIYSEAGTVVGESHGPPIYHFGPQVKCEIDDPDTRKRLLDFRATKVVAYPSPSRGVFEAEARNVSEREGSDRNGLNNSTIPGMVAEPRSQPPPPPEAAKHLEHSHPEGPPRRVYHHIPPEPQQEHDGSVSNDPPLPRRISGAASGSEAQPTTRGHPLPLSYHHQDDDAPEPANTSKPKQGKGNPATRSKNYKPEFDCKICGKGNSNIWLLRRHETIHNIVYSDYMCRIEDCGVYFHGTRERIMHQGFAHGVWECTKCRKVIPGGRDALHKHTQVSPSRSVPSLNISRSISSDIPTHVSASL